MDPLTIMLISGLLQAGTAAYRNIKAQKGLKELEKQRLARYTDASGPIQENKAMYQQMAKFGMGPASATMARNQFAASQNALTAAPAGGQLRTQIGRMASANAGGFANQLAAQNEAIRRQGMAGVAQANLGLSGLQQKDVAVDLQRRMQAEQAYGQAIQDSRREMIGAATGVATGYLGYQNAEANRQMYRDIYGAKQAVPQTPAATFNPVNPAGTFKVAGPQTFDQYIAAGVPAGTTTDGMRSYAPGYQAPTPPMQTPFAAPSGNPFSSLPPIGTTTNGFNSFAPGYSPRPTRTNPYANTFGVPSFNPYAFATPASYDPFGPF